MTKPKVLILGQQPYEGLTELRKYCDIQYQPTKVEQTWLSAHLSDFDGVLIKGIKVDRAFIDAGTKLKIIATSSVGFDHIDIAYARQHGIVVENTPKGVCLPTAELAITLMLTLRRRIVFYNMQMHQGKWPDLNDTKNLAIGLNGQTLGIFGMGRIGQRVAQIAKEFGVSVIYHNRHRLSEDLEQKLNAHYVSFEALVAQSDILSLHAPATSETKNVVNGEVLKKMKSSAILINVARGALVNQSDLIQALKAKQISGAGLDVFDDEPHVNLELAALDQVILTPHAGSGTHSAKLAVAKEASRNLIAYLCEGKTQNRVN